MSWKYEKLKGNAAVYAICSKCGFCYSCGGMRSTTNGETETVLDKVYNYCPFCGSYENDDCDYADIIWNERDISELFQSDY